MKNAYNQCQSCINRKYETLFFLRCKAEGFRLQSRLKKKPHCAAQQMPENEKKLHDYVIYLKEQRKYLKRLKQFYLCLKEYLENN